MSKHGARPTVYVCSAIANDKLICKQIVAISSEQATEIFEKENNTKLQVIFGPFFKKRAGILNDTKEVKFVGSSKKTIYKDWIVSALLLKEPENHAYLLFDKRVDGKKVPKPTGTFIVHLNELKELK